MTQIIPLDRYNWELCLDIKLKPEQESFLPPVLYSLAQAKFENLTPYGILKNGKMVGFLMYGEFGDICWVNRILIDKDYQGMGIGSKALGTLLDKLRLNYRCREIRTSYSADNKAASEFFGNMGFKELGEPVNNEVIAVFEAR
ncbi:MAG: GNAT family N-acetyltransferase [Bacteroidota bacterium]